MIDQYDITAESSTIDQMTTAIWKIEKSSTYHKHVRERRRAHQVNDSPSPNHRERKREKAPYRKGSRSRERRKSHHRERHEEKRNRDRNNGNGNRRERRFEPSRGQERVKDKGKGPNANVTCFSCQQKGHYANDPACPMYGKRDKPALRDRPQVRAARAGNGDLTSEEETESLLGDGSQYSPSSSTDESIHSGSESGSDSSMSDDPSDESIKSETQPQVNRLNVEDSEDSEDLRYVRAVRAKITPAVEEHPSRLAMNRKLDRPKRSKRQETCLAGWIRINGIDAFTLFDSGSNTDTLSPGFAQVANIQTRKLEHQVPLQLGMVGSRAAINYGAQVPIGLGETKCPDYYFDIVNIDRYDCIAGAPMMRRLGVRLDFRDDLIHIGEQRIRALLPDEEAAILRGRQPPKPRQD